MEVKYIKDAPLGKKDQVCTVLEYEGLALISLGFAKEIKIKKNLNGSPVVYDFGNVVQQTVQVSKQKGG